LLAAKDGQACPSKNELTESFKQDVFNGDLITQTFVEDERWLIQFLVCWWRVLIQGHRITEWFDLEGTLRII